MKARDFYLLRIARIVPLFLLLLALLSCLHLFDVKHFMISDATGGLGEALMAAITFRINVLEATKGYLPANWDILWSLSVEEMFYLFFPVACIVFSRTKFMIGVLALFITLGPLGRTVFSQGNEIWKEYSYLGSMDAISLGILTALITTRFRFSRSGLIWLCCTGVSLLIFTLGCSRIAKGWGLNRLGLDMTILAIGTCMILLVAAQSQWKAPRIFYPILKLGELSYEIYLTHMFVILAFFHLFLKYEKPVMLIPLLFIVSILFSGFLGEIVARYYSEPLNNYIRKKLNFRKFCEIETHS